MRANPPTNEEIVQRLNHLYMTNADEYKKQVETLKGVGYRIFRNDKGQHKVDYNNNYFNEVFGGVFGGLFS